MVTLAGTQNLSEFELHARAILGLPIPEITLERAGVSAVILAKTESNNTPVFTGVEAAITEQNTDIRIFGKPTTRPYRRMAVSLVYDNDTTADMESLRLRARALADKVTVS
jgi:phosphoribosylglycinamide formyltransferase 2